MFGQGIGPITDRALRRIAADVFRKLNVLAVRERRASTDELASLGVPLDQVTITGDDAIELAPASPPADGSGLGVNLRIAKYADVAADVAPTVGRILRRVADEVNAPLLPLPVRLPPLKGDDVEAVRQLFPDGGVDTSAAERMDLPGDLVAEAARCRVVVSGSYHSAVFALAQGVPVVGLAVSRYYREKLTGLAEQFGAGAEVVSVDDADLDRTLPEAIRRLWTAAPAVRAPLLAAAERQRQLSRAAYDRFFDLVESRLAGRGAPVPSVTPASS
jgi:colanic acid/amylovoran biosynthesis protein